MKGRDFTSEKYRFGFNGQEKDGEVIGSGNIYTAQFWEYDARLGRRWNLDPKPNESFSYYACFENNPIFFQDTKGDTIKIQGSEEYDKKKGYKGAYEAEVNQALEKLKETKEGLEYYNELQSSKNVFTIQYNAKISNSAEPTDLDASMSYLGEKGGSGGNIFWDPDIRTSGADEYGGTNSPNFINLAHELFGHGLDYNRGTATGFNTPVYSNAYAAVKESEVKAVHIENIIRTGHGLPLRQKYHTLTDNPTQTEKFMLNKEDLTPNGKYILNPKFDYRKEVKFDNGLRPGGRYAK